MYSPNPCSYYNNPMRIDLSSSDAFFLPDRPLTAGRDEGEAPSFGDVLKNATQEENPAAELLQAAEGEIAEAAEGMSQPEKPLKLFLALDVQALDFITPVTPEAEPLTAERLVVMIETSAPEQLQPEAPARPPAKAETTVLESEHPTSQPDQLPNPTEEASAPTETPHPPQVSPRTEHKAAEVVKEASLQTLILETGDKAKADKGHRTDDTHASETTVPATAKEDQPVLQTLPEAPTAFQAYEDNPEDGTPDGQGHAPGGDPGQEQPAQDQAGEEASGDGAVTDGLPGSSAPERELSYEEIQTLVDSTLERNQQLPARVSEIVKELLSALADGHHWLLDQHRLIGLDREEWQLLIQLFPAHFYTGLLRGVQHQPLPLFDILQDLSAQLPPDQARRAELCTLWQTVFGQSLPPLLLAWIEDQPHGLAPEALPDQLVSLLERWQQRQALPPGALGRVLQLALAYRHHPNKMAALFELSRALLHGRPLDAEQRSLLAQSVYERCFPRELTDSAQLRALLEKILTTAEPDENELMQLCGGCAQGVLSYLPPAQLAPSLQQLQDYVRRDLLGREELVPSLI